MRENMGCNLEVVFRNMPEMKSIRRQLEKGIMQLDRKFEGIKSCQFAMELPHCHRYPGNIYDFQIEVDVPGNKLKVSRGPSVGGASSNVSAMIREALNQIDHELKDCVKLRSQFIRSESKDQQSISTH
jgi:hypothetical protein